MLFSGSACLSGDDLAEGQQCSYMFFIYLFFLFINGASEVPRARLQREAKRRVTGADESRNAIRHPGMWRLFGLSRAAQPGIKQRVMNGASEEALAPMSGADPPAAVVSYCLLCLFERS